MRAALLGLLMPATDSPQADRDIFLRLLTMDDEGLWRRKNKQMTAAECFALVPPSVRTTAFTISDGGKPAFRRDLTPEARESVQKRAFLALNYDRRLEYCARPEEIDGPDAGAWDAINAHCGTTAQDLQEFVRQLGERRFGHAPRVGDAFCGGGSIPFEAARIGCEAFGSDLSPVAALLTWAGLNITGGGPTVAGEVRAALKAVYTAVAEQIAAWEIERNDAGWVADAYLYCHEVREQGWTVPLAPSWVIGERTRTIARLVPVLSKCGFDIEIRQGVSDEEIAAARQEGTWGNGVKCPVDEEGTWVPVHLRRATNADSLRGRGGLRRWENDDLVPRRDDVFQERLYCIRWRLPDLKTLLWEEQQAHNAVQNHGSGRTLETVRREIGGLLPFLGADEQACLATLRAREWQAENNEAAVLEANYTRIRRQPKRETTQAALNEAKEAWEAARDRVRERETTLAALAARIPETWYAAPDEDDFRREETVLHHLRERFADWQAKGYIPSAPIQDGDETSRLPKERGYTYWHHLFNPRQLLTLGLFAEFSEAMQFNGAEAVGILLVLGKIINYNSRLSLWHPAAANENTERVFTNQSLNTLANYATRTIASLPSIIFAREKQVDVNGIGRIRVQDARGEVADCDIWITDPAYADAINYEELSEFFLAWYDKRLTRLFPDWYTDSRRALAVRGSDEAFRQAMVECYRNFACHMPDNGLQIVMFTHTNAEVWADLALILWAAGLRVTAAWTIATETDASGLKQGNYVQGTVLLVLRKQTGNEWGDLSDVFPEVQAEVERQMETMTALDDRDDPNFSDSDYQLAAYAAALRILTRYKTIEDIDVEREIRRVRGRNDISPLTPVIEKAVKIASDYLVPRGIDRIVWRSLTPDERLYVKGIEVEGHGDYRSGVYMEFARGYGVRDYRPMLGASEANRTRLKTPTEFRGSGLSGDGFAATLLRQILFAVYKTGELDDPAVGRDWLRREVPNYWDRRVTIVELLRYLAVSPGPAMPHWERDSAAAELLAGLIVNDTL